MIKAICFFFAMQLVNVILNTLKTCVIAKGNKVWASVISGICFGFYTFVVFYTAKDFMNLWAKAGITVVTNLIGTYFSMWLLEKLQKDKLWEIVANVKYEEQKDEIQKNLNESKMCYNIVKNNKGYTFYIYSQNQNESAIIKKVLDNSNAKYFVHSEEVKLK